MGLLSAVLTLPLAPVRGVVWVAEQIEAEARRQFTDPAAIRAQIAELDRAYDAGEVTAQQRDERADELVARLMSARPPAFLPGGSDG